MVQEHIAASHHGKHTFKLAWFLLMALGPLQPLGGLPEERGVLEMARINALQAHQIVEPEWASDAINALRTHLHALHQLLQHGVGHFIGDLQPHHLPAKLAFPQALLQGFHQVIGFQFAQLKVGIAGDPEEVMPLNLHPGEQMPQVEGNQLLEGGADVDGARPAAPVQLLWDLHEAGNVFLGNLDACELSFGVCLIPDQHRNVDTQIADEWERVGRVNGQRREDWKNVSVEIAVGPVFLLSRELLIVEDLDLRVRQVLLELVPVVVLLLIEQWAQLLADRLQLLLGGEPIHAGRRDAFIDLGLQ